MKVRKSIYINEDIWNELQKISKEESLSVSTMFERLAKRKIIERKKIISEEFINDLLYRP